MENFARRGIRTTVAVAGLAALGVGLAAPTAFALPSVPDISGVGNTQAVPSPTGAAAPAGALPGPFRFTPPATEQSTATDAAPSSRAAAEPADEESTESETTEPGESTETTEADESEATEAESTEATEAAEAAPAATTPAPTTQGLLPSIPGSPVAAQASPQVAGVDPSSALQSLDSGSMF
jgi:cell division protein FtsN